MEREGELTAYRGSSRFHHGGWVLVAFLMMLGSSGAVADELSVTGFVRDAEGSPLPQARVLLLATGGIEETRGVAAPATQAIGDDGAFRLTIPAPGLWHLRVTAPGHHPLGIDLHAVLDDLDLPPARLQPEGSEVSAVDDPEPFSWYPWFGDEGTAGVPRSATPRPESGAEFGLRILDEDTGRGIEGAFVWPVDEPAAWVRTDAHGAASLPSADAFRVDAPGFAPALFELDLRQHDEPLVLGLQPTVSVDGVVRDAQGRVVPDARLAVRREFRSAQSRRGSAVPAVRFSYLAQSGTFCLRKLVPSEPYEITVHAPGFAPLVHAWSPRGDPRRPPLELVLEAGHELAGTVTTASGEGLPGAEVVMVAATGPIERRRIAVGDRLEAAPVASITTDPEGAFHLHELPAGPLDLIVRREGFAPASRVGLRFAADHRRLELDPIRLEPTLEVAGRVLDESGEGIGGAAVYVAWRVETPGGGGAEFSTGLGEPLASTDSRGRFVLSDVERGEPFVLVVRAEGFLQERMEGLAAPFDPPGLTVTLSRGTTIQGQVLGKDRQPLAGATVEATPGGGRSLLEFLFLYGAELRAVTDTAGHYRLFGLPVGTYDVEARAPGHQPHTESSVLVERHVGTVEVGFTLQPGVLLEGIVEAPDGAPVAGAAVRAGGVPGSTDRTGRFQLDGVPLGPLRVTANHPAHGRAVESVTVATDGAFARLVFQPTGRVEGVVLDDASRPVGGALVRLLGQRGPQRRVRSADDGTFLFTDVPAPAELSLVAEMEGFVGTRERIRMEPQGSQRVTLVLDPACRVTGRVSGLDAAAMESLSLYAHQPGSGSLPGNLTVQGEYSVDGLRDGPWVLLGRTASGLRARAPFQCRPGERHHAVDLEFEEGRPLTVTVLLNGRTLPGADVTVRDELGVVVGGGRTGPGGVFRAVGLEAGEVEVTARLGEWNLETRRTVSLPAEDAVRLSLVRYEVSGLVTDADSGLPVAGATVRLLTLDGDTVADARYAQTNTDGRFLFAAASPGGYTLVVDRPGYQRQAFGLQLAGGQIRKTVSVALPPAR